MEMTRDELKAFIKDIIKESVNAPDETDGKEGTPDVPVTESAPDETDTTAGEDVKVPVEESNAPDETDAPSGTPEVPVEEAGDLAQFHKSGVINHSSAVKKGAIFDGGIKNIKANFIKINANGDKDDIIKFNLASTGKLKFGTALVESADYILEFFGKNKDSNEVKVGGYKLKILGTTSQGFPVAACDKIKVKNKPVTLFGNANFSILNPSVVGNIAALAKVVDSNVDGMSSQAATIYRNNNEGSTFGAPNIGELTYVQGQMSKDGNNTYIDIYMEFATKNTSEMNTFGVLVFYSFGDGNIYINGIKR